MSQYRIQDLLDIMARLRDPEQGCPWDRQQTNASLVPFTLEEAYEVADAIEAGDDMHFCDELGDLLFQIVFYARIAEEEQRFRFDDVVQAICEKLIRRHPHVFGDENIESAEAQNKAWEEHKKKERASKLTDTNGNSGEQPSELDGVSHALPALVRAQKLQRRAARVGFDWDTVEGVWQKFEEELQEIREAGNDARAIEDEIGDLLFTAVNLARFLNVDAETALRKANHKFSRRFRRVEDLVREGGGDMQAMSVAELDRVWNAAKSEEEGS